MYSVFHVANKGEALESIILGRTWMKFIKCQLDWKNHTYSIEVNSQNLTGSSTTGGLQDFLNEAKVFHTQEKSTSTPPMLLVWIPETTTRSDHVGCLVRKSFLLLLSHDSWSTLLGSGSVQRLFIS